jgi:hypothetical protein
MRGSPLLVKPLPAALALVAVGALSAPLRAQGVPPAPYPYPQAYYPYTYTAPQPTTPPKRPSSDGMRLITAGIILTSAGALDLATSPLCATDFVRQDLHTACFATTLVVGGVAFSVGLPMLLVGITKRRRFVEWQDKHDVSFAPRPGGAAITWRVTL